MKKLIFLLLVIFSLYSKDSNSVIVIQRSYFTGNNLCNYFQNTGIFNKNSISGNIAGLYWHCDPMQSYCFSAGLSIACYINGEFGMVSASYSGEYAPGYFTDSFYYRTNPDFKIYKVSRTDNSWSNPDYANWYKMVPFGAPYEDVNNNCIFDRDIDKPGVPDAIQTLFVVLTDGDVSQRNPGEGFGGGVASPILGAEVHLTAWAYDNYLPDVQYLRYQIINKSMNIWDSTYFTMYVDPESPDNYLNDYIGCDTLLQLGFNWANDSVVKGAYGMQLLQGPVNKITGDTLKMSSFNPVDFRFECNGVVSPSSAYLRMKGYKTDGTSYLIPISVPFKRTKFVFSGDPETNTGWTPQKGFIKNCNNADTGTIQYLQGSDTRFLINTGGDNFRVIPGDTQNVYFSQMIAKGVTNKNSVTRLKSLAHSSRTLFKSGIVKGIENNCTPLIVPDDFGISQNFPNPFNSQTVIRYSSPRSAYIRIVIYDLLGKEIAVPVNGQVSAGYHEINVSALNLASGIYFYRMDVTDNTISNLYKRGRTYKMAVVK